jgi:hypothetical protein
LAPEFFGIGQRVSSLTAQDSHEAWDCERPRVAVGGPHAAHAERQQLSPRRHRGGIVTSMEVETIAGVQRAV